MTIELKAAGARALVEPAYGGRLHQLFVEVDGREEPILLSPDDPAAYAGDPLFGGCYPMAPWPNRIRDGLFVWRGQTVQVDNGRPHALHGLVLDQPWEVVARVGRVVEMRCGLGPGWPWEGSVWQRFELGPNFLAMKMEVRSARETFPAGCGWHPWFRRNVAGAADASVALNAARRYVLEGQLPTGETTPVEGALALDGTPLGARRLDDCFTGLDPAVVSINWGRLLLEMAFQSPTPHLQAYTPPDAVCIEPQTCAPDAFNLFANGFSGDGTAVVAPGRPLSLSCRWTWQTSP